MTTEESAEGQPAPAVKRRWPTAAIVTCTALATVLVGVVAFAFYSGTLYFKDPAGAKACSMLSDALDREPTDNKAVSLDLAIAIGDIAKNSTTPGIRATISVDPSRGPEYDALPDLEATHAACIEAGVDMPAYIDN